MTPSERFMVLHYLDKIRDEWGNVLYEDLEHGEVTWFTSEKASDKFAALYPSISDFGEFLDKLEEEINES